MKKITKAMVEELLKQNPNWANFNKKDVDALFALYHDSETTFARIAGEVVNLSDTSDEKELEEDTEEQFAAASAKLKDSLEGSKWQGLVNSQSGDFVKKRYRMLSAGMVQGVYDFGHEDGKALKEAQAAGKFDDLRFFKDHVFSVDSIVGVVGKSFWNEDGVPGVDNHVFVNKTIDPTFALKFDSGMVDSVSVGINFKRVPSHEFEDMWDFYMLLGREVEGEIVRFLVTDIEYIRELSSVAEGADPHAKLKFSKAETQVASEEVIKDFIAESTVEADKEIERLSLQVQNLEETVAEFSAKTADRDKLAASLQRYEELEKKFEGNLEYFASKGLDQLQENKRKLISFFRITGRSTLAHSLEVSTDFAKAQELYALFASDIENSVPDVCPTCNNEVTLSKQASREPIAPEEIVFKRAESKASQNVDEFCAKVHK